MIPEKDYKSVEFGSLAIGDTFFTWGDYIISTANCEWWECIKTGDDSATKKGGLNFFEDPSSVVSIEQ